MARFGYSKGASSAVIVIILIVIVALIFFLSPSLFSGIGGGQGIGVGLVGPGTQGVVITSFTPSTPVVEVGGTPVLYTLIIANKGEEPATNIQANIIGGLGSGATPNQPVQSSLSAASISQNIQGGQSTATWQITSPKSSSVDQTYVSTVRVQYTYSTVSTSVIKVATQSYLQSITPPGQQAPLNQFGLQSSSTTRGPFQVSAVVPVSILTNPNGASTVLIQYTITNVGGGRAFLPSASSPTTTNLDQIVTSASATLDTGATVPVTGCNYSPLILNGGSSTILTCTLSVSGVTNFAQITVTLTLNYNYFVDSTTSIKVLKALPGTS